MAFVFNIFSLRLALTRDESFARVKWSRIWDMEDHFKRVDMDSSMRVWGL
jgi:hypothetical protein